MKDTRKTNIKVGITFIVAVILMLIIFAWAKSFSISSNYNNIKIVFKSVSGLEIGDNITINGVKLGKVKDIQFENNKVVVFGIIPKDVILREDATAQIEMMDLMGGKKIEIFPGYSPNHFDLNNYLVGGLNTDIPGALHLIGELQGDIKSLLKESTVLLDKLNNHLLTKEFTENTNNTIQLLNATLANLNSFIDNNESSIKRTLRNTDTLTQSLTSLINENSENIKLTLTESKKLFNTLNSTINSFDSLLTETKSQKNNLGKFLYSDKVYNDLVISLDKLKEISTKLLKQIDSTGIKVEAKIKL